MSCVKSYTFPIGGASTKGLFFGSEADDVNQKYYIDVNIMSAYGEFKLVKIIADTGNDITLITKKTADALGFHPSMGTLLEVSGIREGMVSKFKKITTQIQLGDLTPATVEMAFAVDDESLAENLLGNKGLLSSGQYRVQVHRQEPHNNRQGEYLRHDNWNDAGEGPILKQQQERRVVLLDKLQKQEQLLLLKIEVIFNFFVFLLRALAAHPAFAYAPKALPRVVRLVADD